MHPEYLAPNIIGLLTRGAITYQDHLVRRSRLVDPLDAAQDDICVCCQHGFRLTTDAALPRPDFMGVFRHNQALYIFCGQSGRNHLVRREFPPPARGASLVELNSRQVAMGTTTCEHVLHLSCLTDLSRFQGSCPLCRSFWFDTKSDIDAANRIKEELALLQRDGIDHVVEDYADHEIEVPAQRLQEIIDTVAYFLLREGASYLNEEQDDKYYGVYIAQTTTGRGMISRLQELVQGLNSMTLSIDNIYDKALAYARNADGPQPNSIKQFTADVMCCALSVLLIQNGFAAPNL